MSFYNIQIKNVFIYICLVFYLYHPAIASLCDLKISSQIYITIHTKIQAKKEIFCNNYFKQVLKKIDVYIFLLHVDHK